MSDLFRAVNALAVNRSDEGAWRTVYDTLYPFLFGFLFRKAGGDSQRAADIAQEVFLRLFRYCPFARIDGDAALRAYVGRVAWNECRRALARDARRVEHPVEDVAALDDVFVKAGVRDTQAIGEIEVDDILERVLAGLSASEGELLMMLALEMSPAEIADALGISSSAVWSRIYRLRVKLADSPLRRYFEEQV